MKITQLNHVALHCGDLDASVRFYRDVLGLEPMDRPNFGFPGAWFRIEVDQELHLIARPSAEAAGYSIPRERHYAMAVDDTDAAVARLDEAGVEHAPPKARPDGVVQVFLRDPDGHVIELCGVTV